MGAITVVTSGKGGVGKTTTSANLGTGLAMLNKRVVLVDADIGLRNLDLTLGMTDQALMDFTDVIQGRCSLEKAAAAHRGLQNLYLITAPVTLPAGVDEDGMRRLMRQVRETFDYCIIDCPAGVGTGFRLATCAADRCVVVTCTDASSLRDAQHTVMELERFGTGRLHLVVNRVRKKMLRSMHATIDDAIDRAGLPLLGVVPEDDQLPLCLHHGVPLLLQSSNHAAAAYRNIAKRIQGGKVPLLRIR